MPAIPEIIAFDADMRGWRHHLHAHPETAFEEAATSAFVADKLRSFGLEVHTGIAKTGVVGVLRNGHSTNAVGLRADLDALHIHEKTGCRHRITECRQDACMRARRPHDDAARRCAGHGGRRNFDGTAYFIFQPAEENEGGGREMVKEGLFERFPMRGRLWHAQFSGPPAGRLHSAGADDGGLSTCSKSSAPAGAAMPPCRTWARSDAVCSARDQRAADDRRAQRPSAGSRRRQCHAGTRRRHLECHPTGDRAARYRAHIPAGNPGDDRASHAARSSRHRGDFCDDGDPSLRAPLPGHHQYAGARRICAAAATALVGAEHVDTDLTPSMGSEDFAFMLQAKPGCYILAGRRARPDDAPSAQSPLRFQR